MCNKECVIVLDLGTSSFKCGSVDIKENVIFSAIENSNLFQEGKICECDFEQCFQKAVDILAQVIKDTLRRCYHIIALLITSQAQTFVPVDEEFNPLAYGIVWLDSRADKEALYLSEHLYNFQIRAGIFKHSAVLYVAKLLWLKNNAPDIYKSASCFPLINEFIAYKLTGHFYSDSTNFGMTGVFDICQKELNQEVLDMLELSLDNFPLIKPAACLSYEITAEMKSVLGLKKTIPVFLCGNDQSASSVGAGAEKEGAVSVNFGTAMVLYAFLRHPPKAIGPEQIAGINPLTGDYFIISLEKEVGNIIDAVKEKYFPNISYDDFFAKYYLVKEPGILTEIPVKDGSISFNTLQDPSAIAASVISHFVKRFTFHVSQIEPYVRSDVLYVSGGMAKSCKWLEIIETHCRYKIIANNTRNAALIGAMKIYKSKPGRCNKKINQERNPCQIYIN